MGILIFGLFAFALIFVIAGAFVAAPAGLIVIAEQLIKRTPTVNFKHFWIIWACLMIILSPIGVWWLFTR